MNNARFWLAAAIIAVIILLGFILSVPHTHDVVGRTPAVATTTSVLPPLTFKDAFRKGTHTITGTVLAPNPCTTITATSTLLGDASTSQSILVAISMPPDAGVCLQEQASTTFSTTLAAPAGLPLQITINGQTATTTP